MSRFLRLLSYFVAGVLFALGLVVSGMTQPQKVVAFLDFFGDWDPSLMLVMGGAIVVHALSVRFILRRKAPLWAEAFLLPSRTDIDLPLVGGAVLFGLGWGLSGYCPGPAVTRIFVVDGGSLVFVSALLVTMLGYSLVTGSVSGRMNQRKETRSSTLREASSLPNLDRPI